MSYTTIDDPTKFFSTTLWTGNGTSTSITTGHATDWLWIKNRNDTQRHNLIDSVRGVTKRVSSNTTDAEATESNMLSSFDSNGFTLGTDSSSYGTNTSSKTYVGWSWKAGGTASSNGDGATTASVSVNTTSGISIASVAGNSTNFGHGLGVAPNVIIYKPTSASGSWGFACDPLGMTSGYLGLNSTGAFASGSGFIDGTSSTLVTVGSNIANATNIYYMFAEKKGFSKFGSYTGNGNADGTFVYTGFKPAFVMVKLASGTTGNWQIQDSKRDGFNENKRILANVNEAEKTSQMWDQLSNGFKIRVTSGDVNGSGNSYIYMAFAEAPFVTAGTKAAGTAR
jgi:hypothetical protein